MRGATSKKPGKRPEQPAPRPEYGRGTGVPNPIDVEVGGRIRTRRLLLGMNQQALAPRACPRTRSYQSWIAGHR